MMPVTTRNVILFLSINHLSLCYFFFCRQYSNDYKLDTYLKIARLFLEDEDPVQAEAYINRASLLQADSKDHQLQIYYKVNETKLQVFVIKLLII